MVAPPESQRPPSKRRKRKGATGAAAGGGTKKGRPPINLAGQVSDVMMVGEPSLMGGEFGDENERLITRLENTQCDPAESGGGGGGGGGGGPAAPPTSGLLEENNYTSSPLTSGGSWTSGERPLPPQASTPNSQDSDKKPPAVGQ